MTSEISPFAIPRHEKFYGKRPSTPRPKSGQDWIIPTKNKHPDVDLTSDPVSKIEKVAQEKIINNK